jgi:serine/threonine-protein kinase
MMVGMGSSAGSLIPIGSRSFGRYELLARLATGGMAEIFLARHRDASPGDSSVLVIKRVLPHLAEDSRFVSMFRDEARLAARIEHDNVCRVVDMGSVGDTYFIALEYLHGMPLSRVLVRAARTEQPLDFRLIAGLLVQCCAGLHHAHELKDADGRLLDVVHRDISPPNIFVTASGVVKLLDFGVAKAHGASEKTRTGTVKGKNAYMSPEQVLGQPMDRRSDVFSLGIVLWEALTAQRLFMREVDFETFRAITDGDVPDVRLLRPDTPEELVEVVHHALALRPEQRFPSALALGDAVAAAVAGIGSPAGEQEIAAFIQARFATELAARVQMLDATGASLKGSGGAADESATSPLPARHVRAASEAIGEAETMVRTPATPAAPDGGDSRTLVEIRWAPSRKSRPIQRITTGSIPRMDTPPAQSRPRLDTPPGQPRLDPTPSRVDVPLEPRIELALPPRPVSTAAGTRPIDASHASAGTALMAIPRHDPRSRTMRVKALAPPPRHAPGPHVEDEPPGHEAAAIVFIAGAFSLLVLLWLLL